MNHGFFSFYGFLALSPVNCVFIILIGNSLCRGTFGRQKETPSGLHGEIAWAPCTPYIRSYRTHCPNQSLLVLAVCITSTLLGYFSSPKQVGLKLFTLRYNFETIRPAWRWPTAPKTRFFSKATPQKDLLARQAELVPGSTTEIDGDKHPYTHTTQNQLLQNRLSSGFRESSLHQEERQGEPGGQEAPGSGKVPYIRKNGEENRVVENREVGLVLSLLNPRRRSRFITSEWSTKRFTCIWDQRGEWAIEQRAVTSHGLNSIAQIQRFRFSGGEIQSVPSGRSDWRTSRRCLSWKLRTWSSRARAGLRSLQRCLSSGSRCAGKCHQRRSWSYLLLLPSISPPS